LRHWRISLPVSAARVSLRKKSMRGFLIRPRIPSSFQNGSSNALQRFSISISTFSPACAVEDIIANKVHGRERFTAGV